MPDASDYLERTARKSEILANFKINSETDSDGSFRIFVTNSQNELVAHSRFTKIQKFDKVPQDLKKHLDRGDCDVYSSNIGVVAKFRQHGTGKELYLISLKKLVDLQNGDVMELVQDQSKRKSGDTHWERTKRAELDELLLEDNIQSSVLWTGIINNDPSKLIRYQK